MNYSKVWQVLIKAGARPDDEAEFVHYMGDGTNEYRFRGLLGFGGKYWRGNYVTCYPEDETPELRKIMDEINRELEALARTDNETDPWFCAQCQKKNACTAQECMFCQAWRVEP